MSGAHHQATHGGRNLAHRVAGVEQQVDEHLLQLDAVGRDARRRSRQLGTQGDALALELAVQQGQRFGHDLVQVDALERPLGRADHDTQAADDLAGALVLADDVAQDLAELLVAGLALGEEALRRLGVAENGGQRLVQLMGERAGQFAQHRHARQMRQLAVALLCPQLELFSPENLEVQRDGRRKGEQDERHDVKLGLLLPLGVDVRQVAPDGDDYRPVHSKRCRLQRLVRHHHLLVEEADFSRNDAGALSALHVAREEPVGMRQVGAELVGDGRLVEKQPAVAEHEGDAHSVCVQYRAHGGLQIGTGQANDGDTVKPAVGIETGAADDE